MWTKFFDLASGGGQKTEWGQIYIELPEDEAVEYFKKRFGRNPDNITCECCGSDFSVWQIEGEPEDEENILLIGKDEIDN